MFMDRGTPRNSPNRVQQVGAASDGRYMHFYIASRSE